MKLLITDQSSQAFLCREHDLSGKKKAAVIALSCPRSSYHVPTPLFNQWSFLVSSQLCYPQNYPIIIKSYRFSVVQVSVSLVVFQSLFTLALPNIYSFFIILCHLFFPSHAFYTLDCHSRVCAEFTMSQSSLCSPCTCLTPLLHSSCNLAWSSPGSLSLPGCHIQITKEKRAFRCISAVLCLVVVHFFSISSQCRKYLPALLQPFQRQNE